MIRKEVIAEIKAVSGKERTLEFIGSTESVDRVGDIIEVGGWNLKNFKTNPVFLWAHRYSDPPIGKATRVWKSNGQLKFHIEFADAETYEFADTIYKLYQGGFLNAVSVGFEPLEWEDLETKDNSRGRRYKKQDLLELSAVPVPANAEALMNAREAGVITTKELSACEDEWCKASDDDDEFDPEEKPYPNEHACRLKDPGQYDTCRRGSRTADNGKKYSIIFCKKTGGSMEEQAYRYDKDTWSASEARTHCKAHDGTFEAASEEADKSLPEIELHALITEDDDAWFQSLDQESLKDELDYIRAWIRITGMSDEAKGFGWDLIREIMRLAGDDIPDDIFKVGAVLNSKNRSDLDEAKRRIDNVLASAGAEEEQPKSLWDKAGLRLKP